MVSALIGRLNYHAIDNGYVEVYTSDCELESTSDSVTDTYPTSIKSTDDDETDHIHDFFQSEHSDYILDFDLHTTRA